MAETKVKQDEMPIKKANFRVVEVEENAAIVLFEGWRKRVYFDGDKGIKEGQVIEVEYAGDLNDIHSVEFQKLK